MNKKYLLLLLFSGMVLVVWVLIYNNKKQLNLDYNANNNNFNTNLTINKDKLKEYNNYVENFESQGKSSSEMEKKIIVWDSTKGIWNLYSMLSKNLEKNMINNVPVEKVLISWEWKEKKIKVIVKDADTNKPIKDVSVYLWWWFLWKTDEEWKLSKKIKIGKAYSYMYFQADKKLYTPAYKKINDVYNKWRSVFITFRLKKIWETFDINPNNIKVNSNKIFVSLKGKCLLIDKNSECYDNKAQIEIDYIDPKIIDNISIPMKAVIDWELVNLMTNWMAFIKFYNNKWEKLLFNNKWLEKVDICYKVGAKEIENWKKRKKNQKENSDGYWWFDKSLWVWKFDKNANITIKNWMFCFNTNHIY